MVDAFISTKSSEDTLCYQTSNAAKVERLRQALEGKLRLSIRHVNVLGPATEKGDARSNALRKALEASKILPFPVLASDAELVVVREQQNVQSGDRMIPIISEYLSEDSVLSEYRRRLERMPSLPLETVFRYHYALAISGAVILSDMIGSEVTLSLPGSKKRIAGLPLASLRYIPMYGKWYTDLTEKERRVVDRGQDRRLVALLRQGLWKT